MDGRWGGGQRAGASRSGGACAFSVRSERRRGVLRASGKAVWGGPPVVAADAGLMQIQLWGGKVLRGAQAAPRRMTRYTADPEKRHGGTGGGKLLLKRRQKKN